MGNRVFIPTTIQIKSIFDVTNFEMKVIKRIARQSFGHNIDFSSKSDVLILYHGPELIGFMGIELWDVGVSRCDNDHPDSEYAFVYNFAISPPFRNKGFGKKMLRYMINHVKNDCNRIQLMVDNDNPDAERLYKKCGFRKHCEVGERYVYIMDW